MVGVAYLVWAWPTMCGCDRSSLCCYYLTGVWHHFRDAVYRVWHVSRVDMVQVWHKLVQKWHI